MFYKLFSFFNFRGKNRILNLLRKIYLSKDHLYHPRGYPADIKFFLNCIWDMEFHLLFFGCLEGGFREDLNFIKANYFGTGNILDVGANIGLYSLFFWKEFQTKVIAFEPVQEVFLRLQKNILLNGASVIGESVALGESEGTTTMWIPSDLKLNSGLSSLSKTNSWMKDDKNCLPVTVPITTLDSYCKRNKLDNISLIKIDAEGAELAVIKGASEIIRRYNPDILFECNGDFFGGDYMGIFEKFSRLLPDYEIYFINGHDKIPVKNAILSGKIWNGNWWAVKR